MPTVRRYEKGVPRLMDSRSRVEVVQRNGRRELLVEEGSGQPVISVPLEDLMWLLHVSKVDWRESEMGAVIAESMRKARR